MAAVSGRGAVAAEAEEFSERELEVAAILADLPSIVRAQRRRQRRLEQQARPEIPTWGRRRPRKALPALPAAEKPAAAVVAAAPPAEDDRRRREGAASPDTPLAFHDDRDDEEPAAATEDKAAAQDEWVQQQRGAVASLSHENAHLLKIEEFRARLETSRSTNDSLMQQQSKHKKRYRPSGEEEEEQWRRKLQQACGAPAAVADRPALDLNEPAEADAEDDAKPQTQWFHLGQQHERQQLLQQKAALTAAARRRRREILRAKGSAAASRTRRPG